MVILAIGIFFNNKFDAPNLVLSCPCPRFVFGQSLCNSVAFFTFQQSTYSPSYHFHLWGLGPVSQEEEKHKKIFSTSQSLNMDTALWCSSKEHNMERQVRGE